MYLHEDREFFKEFSENDFYKADYNRITDYFTSEVVSYEKTIRNIKEIADELF